MRVSLVSLLADKAPNRGARAAHKRLLEGKTEESSAWYPQPPIRGGDRGFWFPCDGLYAEKNNLQTAFHARRPARQQMFQVFFTAHTALWH
jgi:hypothetical protein